MTVEWKGIKAIVHCDYCKKLIINKFNDWFRNEEDEDLCHKCWSEEAEK